MTTVRITLYPGLAIDATGEYKKAEEDVGLPESFEILKLSLVGDDLFEIIEWTEAQHRTALTKIEELCIEQINDRK
jgi:hypothetical protein